MAYGKNSIYVDIMAMHPEVTGSCILCIVKSKNRDEEAKFIVDCGLFQEQEYNNLNEEFPFNADELDFVILTHNHIDHTGRIPYLTKKGFNKHFYTTSITKNLVELALKDSCKVLKDVAKRNNVSPLYNEDDVRKALSLVYGFEFETEILVKPNIKVTFFKNGHLLGAAIVLVQISSEYSSENINLLFTGDYKGNNIFFDVPELPDWVKELPLTIIQESTYGDEDSNSIEKCFEDNISAATTAKKDIVIPVFSLGRSQEIAYILKKMQDEKKISKYYPIYMDGPLTLRYTELYSEKNMGIKEEMHDFLPYNLKFINRNNRYEILESEGPKIVLTSSGMGSYGPAQMHIPVVLSRPNGLVHFTGYMAEGTLGRRLKDTITGEAVSVGGVIIKKKGEVKYTTEFSSHAKADEMIEFLNKFTNIKLILVNHGEFIAKEKFSTRILDEVKTKNVGILGCKYLFRINAYGLVKTMPTKFY